MNNEAGSKETVKDNCQTQFKKHITQHAARGTCSSSLQCTNLAFDAASV